MGSTAESVPATPAVLPAHSKLAPIYCRLTRTYIYTSQGSDD